MSRIESVSSSLKPERVGGSLVTVDLFRGFDGGGLGVGALLPKSEGVKVGTGTGKGAGTSMTGTVSRVCKLSAWVVGES